MTKTETGGAFPAWRTDAMPDEGEFFIEDRHGDLIRVKKDPMHRPSDWPWTCMQERTGRLFATDRWLPLPPAPGKGGDSDVG
ncbi:hypothetical protein [Labrys neptuniae]